MFEYLNIANFKSIRDVKLRCTRINLFLGAPNTGKSNLLEAIGFISWADVYYLHNMALQDFIRYSRLAYLFYDGVIHEPVHIETDSFDFTFKYLPHPEKQFMGSLQSKKEKNEVNFSMDNLGKPLSYPIRHPRFGVNFYKFNEKVENWNLAVYDELLPPSGENLAILLLTDKELRKVIAELLEPYGLEVSIEMPEEHIRLHKKGMGVTFSFPLSLCSDSLRRVMFYIAAVETCRNAVVALEEPEAHTFPYYTKYIGERIALDRNNNQYFISTHNPYLLYAILEKAGKEDVTVFLTFLKDGETQIKQISGDELEKLTALDDVFFNMDELTGV